MIVDFTIPNNSCIKPNETIDLPLLGSVVAIYMALLMNGKLMCSQS